MTRSVDNVGDMKKGKNKIANRSKGVLRRRWTKRVTDLSS